MMKDIVCGMEVTPQSKFKAVHGDRDFYFCSQTCQDAFVANPLKYIEKTGVIGSTEGSPKVTESGEIIPSKS
jgi:P-type Cu+ transporter